MTTQETTPNLIYRNEIISHCCGASIIDDSDICTACKDHCHGEKICEICDGSGRIDVIDESRINCRTINPPYKTVDCEKCDGSGIIEVELYDA